MGLRNTGEGLATRMESTKASVGARSIRDAKTLLGRAEYGTSMYTYIVIGNKQRGLGCVGNILGSMYMRIDI